MNLTRVRIRHKYTHSAGQNNIILNCRMNNFPHGLELLRGEKGNNRSEQNKLNVCANFHAKSLNYKNEVQPRNKKEKINCSNSYEGFY